MKKISPDLFKALKLAAAETSRRAEEQRVEIGIDPLPKRSFKKTEYNNFRAARDRQGFRKDSILTQNDAILDGVRDRDYF